MERIRSGCKTGAVCGVPPAAESSGEQLLTLFTLHDVKAARQPGAVGATLAKSAHSWCDSCKSVVRRLTSTAAAALDGTFAAAPRVLRGAGGSRGGNGERRTREREREDGVRKTRQRRA